MARLVGWLILLVVVATPFAILEPEPRVASQERLNPLQIKRARALLLEHDPRRLRDGELRSLALSADELSLVLNYALAPLSGGASRVTVSEEALSAAFTRVLPKNPIGQYLNLAIALTETGGMPAIDNLRIGRVKFPGAVARPLLAVVFRLAYARVGLAEPGSLLRGIEFQQAAVILHYQWHTEIATAVRNQLIPAEDTERLHQFHLKLVEVAAEQQGIVALPALAAPLFAFGVERASKGDPVADNRAALLILSSYVSGQRLTALVPGAAKWPAPQRRSVRVHGRNDLTKHFLNSAALAATGGKTVAHAIGLAKEIEDSRGGSGFSFIDLMADEAGTRFGQRATESRVVAREIQKRAAEATQDLEWIPAPDGLREQMTEADFKRRYGGIEGAGYRNVMVDIMRRIDAVALYK